MIRHIGQIIWNQRAANIYLWLEIVVIFVVLWVCVDLFYTRLITYIAPMGHNIENVYEFRFKVAPRPLKEEPRGEPSTDFDNLSALYERIRLLPEVESVAMSYSAVPYSSLFNMLLAYDTTRNVISDQKIVMPEYFEVFRCLDHTGDYHSLMRIMERSDGFIVSQKVVDALFPDGKYDHKGLYDNPKDTINRRFISAVIPSYRRNDFSVPHPVHFYSMHDMVKTESVREDIFGIDIHVRLKPEADLHFAERFMRTTGKEMEKGKIYLAEVVPMIKYRDRSNQAETDKLKQYASLSIFILINIFLGVIGTFWYRTEQRTSEMGLRLCMGTTCGGLIRQMLTEGLILLAIATVPAALISYNIALAELIDTNMQPFGAGRFVVGQLITFAMMAIMILAGIYLPSQRITKLQPAEALRYE